MVYMDTLPKFMTNPPEILPESCLNSAKTPSDHSASSKPRRNFLSKRKHANRPKAKDAGIIYGRTRKQWQRLANRIEKDVSRFDPLAIMTEGVKTLKEVSDKQRMIEANKETLIFCQNAVPCIHEWAPFKCEHKTLTSMCCRYSKQCTKCKDFSIL